MASTINADNGVVSGSSGVKTTADTSGVLELQSNGSTALSISTGLVTTLTNPLPVGSGGTGATSLSGITTGAATNLAGGVAGAVPYQSGVGTTGFSAAGTTGQVLTSAGTGTPTWTTLSTGGATAQYSVVAKAETGTCVAFNQTDLASGSIKTNNFLGVYAGTAGAIKAMAAEPFWSSYYSKWFCLMQSSSSTIWGLYVSGDGISWTQLVPDIGGVLGLAAAAVSSNSGSSSSRLAVDDSNGRFFYMYSSGSDAYIAYSSLSTNLNTGWTTALVRTSGNQMGAIRYCKMSTTAASGLVMHFADSGATSSYIYTCPAGSTTFTLQTSIGTSSAIGYITYQENGTVFVPLANTTNVYYNTSGNITSGWATGTTTIVSSSQYYKGCVGNGYMVYVGGGAGTGNVYYSTTGSSWTAATVIANVLGVFYTGSNFIAWSSTAAYISASNTPTSFSLYSGGVNTLRYPCNTTYYGQRVTST